MRAVLVGLLLVLGATLVVAPSAVACDGENPCDPPPMQLCPTLPSGQGKLLGVGDWLACWT